MGSDFPTIDLLRDAVKLVRQAKRKVLGENARKLFRAAG
jgi:predicted TIM-barrel fold metal-dependent hydrolase